VYAMIDVTHASSTDLAINKIWSNFIGMHGRSLELQNCRRDGATGRAGLTTSLPQCWQRRNHKANAAEKLSLYPRAFPASFSPTLFCVRGSRPFSKAGADQNGRYPLPCVGPSALGRSPFAVVRSKSRITENCSNL